MHNTSDAILNQNSGMCFLISGIKHDNKIQKKSSDLSVSPDGSNY